MCLVCMRNSIEASWLELRGGGGGGGEAQTNQREDPRGQIKRDSEAIVVTSG